MPPQLARKSPPINHFDSRRNFCHPQVNVFRLVMHLVARDFGLPQSLIHIVAWTWDQHVWPEASAASKPTMPPR